MTDTALGINRDFLPHVFDRFSQEKTGITRRHGGLGLGLAIVRQLVELHGRTVRVVSEGEGEGAVLRSASQLWARRSESDPLAARKVIHLGA